MGDNDKDYFKLYLDEKFEGVDRRLKVSETNRKTFETKIYSRLKPIEEKVDKLSEFRMRSVGAISVIVVMLSWIVSWVIKKIS